MKITGIRTFLMHVGQPSGGNVSVPVPETSGSYNPETYNEQVYVQTRVARYCYFNR
ncbi:hypothetical protein NXC14_PC00412 (plasmid) [Rhizobium sp. NXC14]|nr:hypothetical protein NXC14_PC00412 [Rhizobium sp. NXC14]